MPTDCSAGPSAPAAPNSSAATKAAQRIPAREDDQRHRHQALAARQALVPAAGIVERQEGAADAGEDAAGGGGEQGHRHVHGGARPGPSTARPLAVREHCTARACPGCRGTPLHDASSDPFADDAPSPEAHRRHNHTQQSARR